MPDRTTLELSAHMDESLLANLTRSALRHLYGAAGAHLRGDFPAMGQLLEQAMPELGLAELLEAGVLSVAEQLRDVAADRGLRPDALLRVLGEAHGELAGDRDLYCVLLAGCGAYLTRRPEMWDTDDLCRLAASPRDSLLALAAMLSAAVTWRARDLNADPARIVEHVCLGLAARDAGLDIQAQGQR